MPGVTEDLDWPALLSFLLRLLLQSLSRLQANRGFYVAPGLARCGMLHCRGMKPSRETPTIFPLRSFFGGAVRHLLQHGSIVCCHAGLRGRRRELAGRRGWTRL